MTLLLVRHAMPDATPASPPETWRLSEEGRRAADRLRPLLPAGAHLVSSAEPKAWQTLGGTDAVHRDPRFNEVSRVGEPWGGSFRELRRRYVEGESLRGWEPQARAARRFGAGVSTALEQAHGAAVVVASHGMVMTCWFVAEGLVAPGPAAGAFWADLRFPDCWVLDDDGLRRLG